jgi:biopolymer transport protein ExbD
MKIRERPSRRARIEIIPMIDVIFFLLVFFMLSSLSMTTMNALPVALPKTEAPASTATANTTITVKRSGELLVNKAAVTLDSLGEALARAMATDPQQTVVVNADEGASYGMVVRAMERARRIGARKFALATDARAGEPRPGSGP